MSSRIERIDIGEVKSLSNVITDKLTEMIHSGELRPGERLVQTDLAARFGVSRVAIRDALQELRRRGLAVSAPTGGMEVRHVSVKTIRDVFAVRKAVETLAVREAVEHIDEDRLRILEQRLEEQERARERGVMGEIIQRDWEFHQTLISFSGNTTLLEIIENLWSRSRQARGLAQIDSGWGEQWSRRSVEGHRRLLNALRERDAELAMQITCANIQKAESELIEWVRRLDWEEPGT